MCQLLPPCSLYPRDPETFWSDFIEDNYIIEQTVSEEQLEFLRKCKCEILEKFLEHMMWDGNDFSTLEKVLKIVYNRHHTRKPMQ